MIKLFANLIQAITEIIHWFLSFFVDEKILLNWKPIHLCWWFRKHGWKIPKYFIGADYDFITTCNWTSTGTFTLQDVINAIPSASGNLASCFAYANSNGFASSYAGAKDRLSNFRAYSHGSSYYDPLV